MGRAGEHQRFLFPGSRVGRIPCLLTVTGGMETVAFVTSSWLTSPELGGSVYIVAFHFDLIFAINT